MSLLTLSVFGDLLFNFQSLLSAPSFNTFVQLGIGAVVNNGRQTVTNMIVCLPDTLQKHFSSYHRFFNKTDLSLWAFAHVLCQLVFGLLPTDAVIHLVVDDTTTRHKGPKVYGRGSWRDTTRSTNKKVVFCYGHQWVVISALVKLPGVTRSWALPLLVFLTLPVKHPKHRKHIDLVMDGLEQLMRWFPQRHFLLIGDYAYGAHRMGAFIQAHHSLSLVSRFRMDAVLHDLPAPKKPGRGRPRIKGDRLLSPKQEAELPGADWVQADITWYQGQIKHIELLSRVAQWYHSGQGLVQVRWVVVKMSSGKLECFFTTDVSLSPQLIAELYVRRWAIEVTFEETRRHLHIEQTEVWAKQSVQRLVPFLFGLFNLTIVWFKEQTENQPIQPFCKPWYDKTEITYNDVITYIRQQQIKRLYFFNVPRKHLQLKNHTQILNLLCQLISQAA